MGFSNTRQGKRGVSKGCEGISGVCLCGFYNGLYERLRSRKPVQDLDGCGVIRGPSKHGLWRQPAHSISAPLLQSAGRARLSRNDFRRLATSPPGQHSAGGAGLRPRRRGARRDSAAARP